MFIFCFIICNNNQQILLQSIKNQYCLYYIYCMLSSRKEGFIIRKARRLDQSQANQQRRHMSQTQFYRKQSPYAIRSPGQIVHVHDRQDSDNIVSHYIKSKNNQDIFFNNPQNVAQIKYDFQESGSDLKQIGQTGNIHNDKSYQILQVPTGLAAKINLKIQQNIKLAKILQKLHYQLQHRTHSSQILECVKLYIQHIDANELSSVNNVPISIMRKKLLRESFVCERISVVLIGLIQVLEKYEDVKSYLGNLIMYSFDNLLLRLAILTEGKDKQVLQLLKQEKKQKYLNKGYDLIKNNNQILFQLIIKVASLDKYFYQTFKKLQKQLKASDPKAYFMNIRQFIAYYLCQTNRNQIAPFLSLAPAPYLPPQQFQKYTLVIDIFQCLFTRNRKSVQTFRPFAEYFLDEMSQYYQIVSYCDVMPSDGDRLIALLDRKKCIKYKLYKPHMNKMKGPYGKDLSRLGRDLEKVVLIDTCKDVDSTNTIVIAPWKGKKNDAQLAQICPILAMIALKKLNPQKAIKKLQQKNEQNLKLGLKHLNCGVNLQ